MKKRSKKLLILSALVAFVQPLKGMCSQISVDLAGLPVTITPAGDADFPAAAVCLKAHCFTVPVGHALGFSGVSPGPRPFTSVRDGYLFVRSDSGGNCWRCVKAHVFALRNGELVHLGAVAADGFPVALASEPDRNGEFFDIDDQLEGNRLTSHADAPGVAVALQERDGRFVYDPAWCWRLNAAAYVRQDDRLKRPDGRIPYYGVAAAYLNKAVIDRYCARTEALQADLFKARARLPAETYATLAAVLGSMTIGKRPADAFTETNRAP